MLEQGPDFWCWFDTTQFSYIYTIVFTQYVFNPNVTTFQSNFAEGLHFSAFIILEISHRTQWWCLKCVIVYLARDILGFVMYYMNGESGSSLLIESTDSMIVRD